MKGHIDIDLDLIKHVFVPRSKQSHKGSHGHSLLVAGSKGKMGAAVIAAMACLRSGTGLLTVCCPEEERTVLQITVPEAMVISRDSIIELSKYSAIGLGPAIGLDDDAHLLLKKIIDKPTGIKLVLDADSLTILAQQKELWKNVPEGTIITPHTGEFDRMFGVHASAEGRIETSKKISKQYGWIVILKGFETMIIKQDEIFKNTTGNPGLAKGGSGDALTGIITAFLAQGYSPLNSAQLSVYLHGLAADIALASESYESLLISDVINCLGAAFRSIDTHSYQ